MNISINNVIDYMKALIQEQLDTDIDVPKQCEVDIQAEVAKLSWQAEDNLFASL